MYKLLNLFCFHYTVGKMAGILSEVISYPNSIITQNTYDLLKSRCDTLRPLFKVDYSHH